MTSPDQIKTIAADFLRALATVPGLFARWQAETSPAVRADIVREQLSLAQILSADDVNAMAKYAEPQARRVSNAPLTLDIPLGIIGGQPSFENALA
jgi:hypothetical protein